jgi:hypothetical protein
MDARLATAADSRGHGDNRPGGTFDECRAELECLASEVANRTGATACVQMKGASTPGEISPMTPWSLPLRPRILRFPGTNYRWAASGLERIRSSTFTKAFPLSATVPGEAARMKTRSGRTSGAASACTTVDCRSGALLRPRVILARGEIPTVPNDGRPSALSGFARFCTTVWLGEHRGFLIFV